MGLDLEYNNGQTPIDEDEKEGLLIPTITNRSELDEFEQLNIEKAVEHYLIKRSFDTDKVLSESFIFELHKKMFSDVWAWAGKTRMTNKNIGVDKFQISIQLRQLIENTKYWIKHNTFSEKEIALRFKHGIVAIHVFPNGNGRHSRLMADIIMRHVFNQSPFYWGVQNLEKKNDHRDRYIEALRSADNGDFNLLMDFAPLVSEIQQKRLEQLKQSDLEKDHGLDLEQEL